MAEGDQLQGLPMPASFSRPPGGGIPGAGSPSCALRSEAVPRRGDGTTGESPPGLSHRFVIQARIPGLSRITVIIPASTVSLMISIWIEQVILSTRFLILAVDCLIRAGKPGQ